MRLLPWLIVHLGAGSAAYVVSVDVRRAGRPLEHFWRSTGFCFRELVTCAAGEQQTLKPGRLQGLRFSWMDTSNSEKERTDTGTSSNKTLLFPAFCFILSSWGFSPSGCEFQHAYSAWTQHKRVKLIAEEQKLELRRPVC